MDKKIKQEIISWSGVIIVLLGFLIVVYFLNVISTLYMWGVFSRETSFFLFRAQVIIRMLGFLVAIIGVILIFYRAEND